MSGAGSSGRERPRRDFLLTIGVAVVVVGTLAIVASAVRGELIDAALAVLAVAGGALLWRWRRSMLG